MSCTFVVAPSITLVSDHPRNSDCQPKLTTVFFNNNHQVVLCLPFVVQAFGILSYSQSFNIALSRMVR
jgi:hypothetical protein